MRISLLLEREPFGLILEKTLARFWQDRYDQSYRVRWYGKRPNPRAMRGRGEQIWLGNIYLNAIFTPDVEKTAFQPVRCEFARSTVWWRRLLQLAYVTLASSPAGMSPLAQVGLGVRPPVPGAANQIILGGNHKIRILDHKTRLAYSILKERFDTDFMHRELEARRLAERLGLPLPRLVAEAEDGSWFSECYVVATPINRLADVTAARRAVSDAARALHRLLRHTMQEEPISEYVGRLACRTRALIGANHLLSKDQKQFLFQISDRLFAQITALPPAVANNICTSLTHGDFQPGNILVNQDGVWLIDWEYSWRRQVGYDGLVFSLRSRFPSGLGERLQSFVSFGIEEFAWTVWPGMNCQEKTGRRLHALVFLLEELVLHLRENANPHFTQIGKGLKVLQMETHRFLVGTSGRNAG